MGIDKVGIDKVGIDKVGITLMIDYVGFLGLFTESGRFCTPISLFLGHPCIWCHS